MAELVVIRNPFDTRQRDVRTVAAGSLSVEALVGEYLPAGTPEGTRLTVVVNGRVVPQEEWNTCIIGAEDQMVAMPVLMGGDDGFLGSVLSIALMVAAPYVAAGIGGYGMTAAGVASATAAWGAAGMAMATMAVGLVGSRLIGSLIAPEKPQLPGLTSFDTSPSYSWAPATTQEPGGPIARAYGTVKLHGNIVAGYIENVNANGSEQNAHLLIDLGMGPYSNLRDLKINGQPISYYSGVNVTTRMGHLNQTVIGEFSDTRVTNPIGTKAEYNVPLIRDTANSDFDALEIVLTLPNGLFYSNNSGGLDEVKIDVKVEISGDGGSTWTLVSKTSTSSSGVASGYWSRGSWANGELRATTSGAVDWEGYPVVTYSYDKVWVETEVGSTTQSDHTEGASGGSNTIWHWLAGGTKIATSTNGYVTIAGKQQGAMRFTLRADNLNRGTTYKVKVTRLTVDQTDARYSDDLYLGSIDEVLYDDFTYPRTVLVGVKALATEQISGSISFECIGDCAIIRTWNGTTWTSEFSNNPAWVTWDILTQPVLDNSLAVLRYDGVDPSRLILADFYAWAQWCDELVPKNGGGTEKRCTFDGIYDTDGNMWEAALEVAASARATLIQKGTKYTVVFDRARTTPTQLFSVGNTTVNSFHETFLQMSDRACAIDIGFMNKDDDYARDKITVVDPAVTESAAQRVSISNRGITRASQAYREVKYRLEKNRLLRRTAELGVDIDSLACTVGDLIYVQDDVTRWGEGGRLVSGTTTQLVLDHTVTLDGAKSYEVTVRLNDDTVATRALVAGQSGTTNTINISALPSAPTGYEPYSFGETGKSVKPFLVTDVSRDGNQRATLSLIEYNSSVYNVDSGIPTVPTPDLSAKPPAPAVTNLTLEEGMELRPDGTINVFMDVRFTMNETCATARVVVNNGAGTENVVDGSVRFNNLTSGTNYLVRVTPIDGLGRVSPASTTLVHDKTVVGKLAPPANVASMIATVTTNGVELDWTAVSDIDLNWYEIKQNLMALPLVKESKRSLGYVPLGSYDWSVRALDTTDHYSLVAATASAIISAPAAPTLTASFNGANAILEWNVPSASYGVDEYEFFRGAVSLGRVKTTYTAVPVNWSGALDFSVRAIDKAGNVGATGTTSVTATPAGAPSITAQIIGTKVSLVWSNAAGGSLPVARYAIRHGVSFAAGTEVAVVDGLSYRAPVDWLGDRTYWISAIDTAGNYGTAGSVVASIAAPAAPLSSGGFQYDQAYVEWQIPAATLPIDYYEVRYGSDFASGTSLGKFYTTRTQFPAQWAGSRSFFVRATDILGNAGAIDSTTLTVSVAAAPTLTGEVIDNNVLLRWNQVQGTLPTATYELRRGSTWAGATVIGDKSGGFTTVFETAAGTYTDWLAAQDTAGNYGTSAAMALSVNQPPDYVLKSNYNSTFSGTKTNMVQDTIDSTWVLPVNSTETFATHFTARGWASPQDQISAGYPLYAQPNLSPASYVETIDYGTVLASNKITVTLTSVAITGTVTPSCTIQVSPDNATWTTFAGVWSAFATSFRYVRIAVTFTAAGNTDLLRVSGLNIRLDSKLKTITKMLTCAAADSGGTIMYLTDDGTATGAKLFIDVDAIQVTPAGTTPLIPVYDFTDAPNPLSLKALLFTTAGARASGTASITVRGF